MLIIILTATISVFLAYFFYKQIHKYNVFLYGFAVLMAFAFHESGNIITMGYVPFGMFLVVMFTGVLSKGVIRKRLAMVRAEYAIIGTILLSAHAIGYIDAYFKYVFPRFQSVSMLIGVITFMIIIPLFITSFQKVRKKMKYKTWKSLHRASYIVYVFIFLHLLFMQNDRFYSYLTIAITYIIFKSYDLYKQYRKKRKEVSV